MKHIKLFEQFILEKNSIPASVKSIFRKIQLDDKVVDKAVLNPNNNHVANLQKGNDAWLKMLDQKIRATNLNTDFEIIETDARDYMMYRKYKINDYITMTVVQNEEFSIIRFDDAISAKLLKRQDYYGTDEETTDAVAAAISANINLFNQLKTASAGEGETPLSISKLNNDSWAKGIKKRIRGYDVTEEGAISIAHAILLMGLKTGNPAKRRDSIQAIINIFNEFIKDKSFIQYEDPSVSERLIDVNEYAKPTLYDDWDAKNIENDLRDFGPLHKHNITSIAYGILLLSLDIEPKERLKGLKDVIRILTKYTKDKKYMSTDINDKSDYIRTI